MESLQLRPCTRNLGLIGSVLRGSRIVVAPPCSNSNACLPGIPVASAMAVRVEVCLTCPACGSRTRHRHLYSKQDCDILQCEICGLGRAEVSRFDPLSYYNEGYFTGGHADGYADY